MQHKSLSVLSCAFVLLIRLSALAELLVYVRYIHLGKLKEEFFFRKPLALHTRGTDVLEMVDEYFTLKSLDWKNVVGVCTDGTPSMLGCNSGFQTLVKQKNNDIVFVHCMIHRQASAVKTMPPALQVVMKEVIKVINFVKNCSKQDYLLNCVVKKIPNLTNFYSMPKQDG